MLISELAAQVSFDTGALEGARGAEAASHLAPAVPQGVGGPGGASAVRWGGLGGKNEANDVRAHGTVTCESATKICNEAAKNRQTG